MGAPGKTALKYVGLVVLTALAVGAAQAEPLLVIGCGEPAVVGEVTVVIGDAPLLYYGASVSIAPGYYYLGAGAWGPGAALWRWQVAPPTGYYSVPYSYWHYRWYPRAQWRFVPNPEFDKTIYGMLFLPPQPPQMAFQPGERPGFRWAQGRRAHGGRAAE